ncbi:MAG TPA: hypothetical protein VK324_08750 [Tepidisphaeraceae bacterium]|nr:hypothetical protein [Tepidisphaeraceae bacterium]
MVTNSSAYGLTVGSYQAEFIEISTTGRKAVDPDRAESERLRARFTLAIDGVEWFKRLYSTYAGHKLPAISVMRDYLRDAGLATEFIDECVATFVVNCKFLGLLREIAGAERLLTIEHVLEEIPAGRDVHAVSKTIADDVAVKVGEPWANKCFYITPIGEEGSEERKHADLFMTSLIEPAISALGLTVVRADQIGEPGMITTQVFEHLKRCRLAIADMSHRNANVFYEMAVRHAARLPVIQLIRRADRLPFDLNQVRTVVVDTTDIYSLVPKLDVYRSEIQTQARAALEDPAGVSNPITFSTPTSLSDSHLIAASLSCPISSGSGPARARRYSAISFWRTSSGVRAAAAEKRTRGNVAWRAAVARGRAASV